VVGWSVEICRLARSFLCHRYRHQHKHRANPHFVVVIIADCMDEDLEEALFQDEWDGSQAGDGFEELDDDFILQAGKVRVCVCVVCLCIGLIDWWLAEA
jgi:hypothetical protein